MTTLPAATAAAVPAADSSLWRGGRLGACIGSVALVSTMAFEAMAVAAAMPAIADALDGIALVALAFGGMLALSVLGMVMAGRWCDRDGPLKATVIGLAVFGLGLLLAGFAADMRWLVLGRTVQGLGAGMLGVTLYVGMGQLVPAALHPRLFALFAAAWVLPSLVGPSLAAWLVEHQGWRTVFLAVAAVLPLAAALLLPAFGRLPRVVSSEATEPAPLGWAVLAALGALLLHSAGLGGSPLQLALLPLLGLACVLPAARRLLPVGSLRAANGLPAVIALRALLAAAFATAEVFVPLVLTHERGWSLAEAGLTLSAAAVCWSGGSALQARVAAHRWRRRLLRLGLLAVAFGIATLAALALGGGPAALLVAGWSVAGFGIGVGFPMLSVMTLSLSPAAEQGRHASALQLADALGCTAALAAAGLLFNRAGAAGPWAYAPVFALAVALALAGALLAPRAFATVAGPPRQ